MDIPRADDANEDRLSALEIFEIAEQVQADAVEFYESAAASFPHLSNLFLEVARREQVCHVMFTEMKQDFVQTRKPPRILDDSTFRGIAALNVFAGMADPETEFEGLYRKEDILQTIMHREQEILHYLFGLRNFVKDPTARAVLNRIVQEKQNQVRGLENLREL